MWPGHRKLSLNACSELSQFFIESLVAAIDVMHSAEQGRLLGSEPGEQQGRTATQIVRHGLRSMEPGATVDLHAAFGLTNRRAKSTKLGTIGEAIWKHFVGNRTRSVGQSEQCHELRLHVGRNARIRRRHDVEGEQAAAAVDPNAVVLDI